MRTADIERELAELNRSLDAQHRIIEDCKKHRSTFAQIPEYVGLRDEINREFEKAKYPIKKPGLLVNT